MFSRIFQRLKKHFIPHEGNDHQPHFLRTKNIRYLIGIVFLFELGVLLIPFIPSLNATYNNYLAAILPTVLDDLTNRNRQGENLSVLTVNPLLNKVAELKAQDMAAKSYFAHTSPEGKNPWYWFNLAGYKYEYAGENLAVDFKDSEDVTLAWMNSPTHKANILKASYTEIGTGIATGTYQGNPTVFVAQVFAKPLVVNKEVPAPEVVSTPETTIAPKVVLESKPAPEVMGVSTKVTTKEETKSIATGTPTTLAIDSKPAAAYTKTNIFEKYLTAPRHIVNIVFIIFGVLVTVALIFKLFIRMDKKHPVLITNGFLVLIIILGFYVSNDLVAKNKMAATTSFAGFHAEEFDQNK